MTSQHASVGMPERAGCCATKDAALVMIAKCMAIDHGAQDIRIDGNTEMPKVSLYGGSGRSAENAPFKRPNSTIAGQLPLGPSEIPARSYANVISRF